MSIATVTRMLALLALIAGSASAVATSSRVTARLTGSPRFDLGRHVPPATRLWLVWFVAAVATAGSLYYSEVAGFVPCRLCWYQRIAMYPLSLILLIAALRRDSGIRRYALPLAGIGAAISAWHYVLQWFPQLDTASCDPAAPCAAFYVREFGFVSIPFMALMGFLAIATGLTLHPQAPAHRRQEPL